MSFSLSFHFVSFLTFLLHVQHFPFVYYFLSERRRTVSLPPFFPIENKMEETKLWSHVNFRPPSSSTLVLSRNRFLFGIERSWKLLKKKKKRTSITRDFFFFFFFFTRISYSKEFRFDLFNPVSSYRLSSTGLLVKISRRIGFSRVTDNLTSPESDRVEESLNFCVTFFSSSFELIFRNIFWSEILWKRLSNSGYRLSCSL